MDSLTDKTVVITGAASGIGRATARAAAARGANVVVADLDEPGGEAVAAELRASGSRAIAVPTDVGADTAFDELRDATLAEFGRVDVVMNNAGVLTRGLPEYLPVEEWQRVLNINLLSVVRSNAAFLPLLLERGSGHLVNTASFAGLFSYAFDRMPYAAAKAAVVIISEELALYLKPKGIGVTVLCPGPVATNIGSSVRTFGPETHTRGPGAQYPFKDPADVGEQVIEAILHDRFMVLTDDQVVDVLVRRARDWDGFVAGQIRSMA
jgi:NAD(P)-dependent dehydrogenase (short-subunit alcohol dehydrogenase family)